MKLSFPIRRHSVIWRTTFLLVCVASTGCNRNEIKVYRVDKEPPAPAAAPGQLPSGHPELGAAAQPRLNWTVPNGWTAVSPGEMRAASFNVKDQAGKQADVSVIPLPGAAGGDLANVNRWRGQVGLQALSEPELGPLSQSIEVGGQPAALYDISGTNASSGEATRILATIQRRDGTAWFFKMTGDDALVAQQKAAFIDFLKSFQFNAQEAAAMPVSRLPMEGASLPAGHPDISTLNTSAPEASASTEGQPSWQVPSGWHQVPAGQFLVAKFAVTGEGGAQAAVNVSMSAGDGGGLANNVNRWRKQLGLAEQSAGEINKSTAALEVAGGTAALVEMSGTDPRTSLPSAVVGAVVSQSGQTWFYKLMGDAKAVEAQKDAFKEFVRGVKY